MFENPLNAALLPPILYLIYRLIFPPYPVQKKPLPSTHLEGDYNWMPEAHPPVMCSKKYTVKDLYPFNGRNEKEPNGGKILLAIARLNPDGSVKERTVFDVSNGRNFYGPGELEIRGCGEAQCKICGIMDGASHPITPPCPTPSLLNRSRTHEHADVVLRRNVRQLCRPRRVPRHGQTEL